MRNQELSNTEKEVLRMCWDNLSVNQIADATGCSPSWVNKTYKHIHLKLNTYTRIEMIRRALEKGIISL